MSEKPTGISRLTSDLIRFYTDKFGSDNIICIVSNDTPQFNLTRVFTELKPFNIFDFFKFRTFVKSLSIDLLHAPFYSSLFLSIDGVVSIVTLPDLMYRFTPGFFGNSRLRNILARLYFDLIVSLTIYSSNKIISISKTTAHDLIDWLNIESDVIYPVVEVHHVSNLIGNPSHDVLKEFSVKPNEYFLYVGNNRPHKNLNFLIQEFSNSSSKFELIIAGNAVFTHSDKRIRGIGTISEFQLMELYKNMRCFIFPSKYEGFGLPLVEASLIGKRIIAADIPVFRELHNQLMTFVDMDSPGKLTFEIDRHSLSDLPTNNTQISMDYSYSRFHNEMSLLSVI